MRCSFKVLDENANDAVKDESDTNSTLRFDSNDDNYIFKYDGCDSFESLATMTRVMILFIITIIFLIFTCCMLFEQLDSIESGVSKIARMKMRIGKGGSELARVAEDFNEMFGGNSSSISAHWFSPFIPVKFPEEKNNNVMGYEWCEEWGREVYNEAIHNHLNLPSDQIESCSIVSDANEKVVSDLENSGITMTKNKEGTMKKRSQTQSYLNYRR